MKRQEDLCACGQPKDTRAKRCMVCFRASQAKPPRAQREPKPGRRAAYRRDYQLEWYHSDPERKQRIALRRAAKQIGLDPDDIERRFAEHNGLCDCCGKPPVTRTRLSIDHDHNRPGVFRGFLCSNCNFMLGHAKDDPDILLAGVAYLRG